MARDTFMVPTAPLATPMTARLGAGSGSSNVLSSADIGKFVKLAGESRFDLCVAGDEIEGKITSVELATQNGYSIGGVRMQPIGDMTYATCDGLQATPGTGAIAVGDIVVCGSITAKGTVLAAYAKICKATTAASVLNRWRVVSLPTGSGAVGATAVIQRIA